MMRPSAEVAVYLCVAPVDGRKQAASLALLVEQSLGRNVFEPALYVLRPAVAIACGSCTGNATACVCGASAWNSSSSSGRARYPATRC